MTNEWMGRFNNIGCRACVEPATIDQWIGGHGGDQAFRAPGLLPELPQQALPVELRDGNERGIWRLVNNHWLRT